MTIYRAGGKCGRMYKIYQTDNGYEYGYEELDRYYFAGKVSTLQAAKAACVKIEKRHTDKYEPLDFYEVGRMPRPIMKGGKV